MSDKRRSRRRKNGTRTGSSTRTGLGTQVKESESRVQAVKRETRARAEERETWAQGEDGKAGEQDRVLPYSYHTFLYPLYYSASGKKDPLLDWIESGPASGLWEEEPADQGMSGDPWSGMPYSYNVGQYFVPKARELVAFPVRTGDGESEAAGKSGRHAGGGIFGGGTSGSRTSNGISGGHGRFFRYTGLCGAGGRAVTPLSEAGETGKVSSAQEKKPSALSRDSDPVYYCIDAIRKREKQIENPEENQKENHTEAQKEDRRESSREVEQMVRRLLRLEKIRLCVYPGLHLAILTFETENEGEELILSAKEQEGQEEREEQAEQAGIAEPGAETRPGQAAGRGREAGKVRSARITDTYRDLDQEERLRRITEINSVGRRLFAPFLTKRADGRGYLKGNVAPEKLLLWSADSQGRYVVGDPENERVFSDLNEDLEVPRQERAGDDPKEREKETLWRERKAIWQEKEALWRQLQRGRGVLSHLEEFFLGSEKETADGRHRPQLLPLLDDRMFTCCLLAAQDLPAMRRIEEGTDPGLCQGGAYYWYQDARGHYEAAAQLYQLAFLETGLSCQSREMLDTLLREHIYNRWIDDGTLQAVTEYSLVCIVSTDEDHPGRLNPAIRQEVIVPFLTEYVEMARIALAQRAALMRLETEVTRVAGEAGRAARAAREKNTAAEQTREVDELWEQYVAFEEELLIPEITFQEQGRELYDLFKTSFRIPELNAYLNSKIHHLHEWARLRSDEQSGAVQESISRTINFVTFMSLSVALAALVVTYLPAVAGGAGSISNAAWLGFEIGALGLLGIDLVLMFLWYHLEKKCSGKRRFVGEIVILAALWAAGLVVIGIVMTASMGGFSHGPAASAEGSAGTGTAAAAVTGSSVAGSGSEGSSTAISSTAVSNTAISGAPQESGRTGAEK